MANVMSLHRSKEKKLNLQVAWVEADNLYPRVETILDDITAGKYAHLDAGNSEVKLVKDTIPSSRSAKRSVL